MSSELVKYGSSTAVATIRDMGAKLDPREEAKLQGALITLLEEVEERHRAEIREEVTETREELIRVHTQLAVQNDRQNRMFRGARGLLLDMPLLPRWREVGPLPEGIVAYFTRMEVWLHDRYKETDALPSIFQAEGKPV